MKRRVIIEDDSPKFSLDSKKRRKVVNRFVHLDESEKPVDIDTRTKEYTKPECWQYDIRVRNMADDLRATGLTKEQVSTLRVSDFQFRHVTDKDERAEMIRFIERHEWLGTISQYTTHWFGAYYGRTLAGVILFNLPNTFSKLLGENTKELERLISRGACISWSPKNLASSFMMWCIKYMVDNTQYRLFSAYSDPSAKELGTIYQACGFYYIGQNSGATDRYVNPYTGKITSSRFFRQKTAFRQFAKELGIPWGIDWSGDNGIRWENIPEEIEQRLREHSRMRQSTATKVMFPSKHKYVYVLGRSRRETRELRAEFEKLNKTYPYPKLRGN